MLDQNSEPDAEQIQQLKEAGIATIKLRMAFTNSESLQALQSLQAVLKDVAEDFGYREDVREAIQACNDLLKFTAVVEITETSNISDNVMVVELPHEDLI